MAFNFTQAEFDLWAPNYDQDAQDKTRWVAHKHVAEALALHAGQKHIKRIIDLGTGTGLLIPALKDTFTQASVTGIDLSENMLEECRKKNIADVLQQFDLAADDWSPLAQHGKAQIVVSSGLLEFIPKSEPFIMKATNMLEDDGIMVLTYQPPQISKGPIGASPSYSHSDRDIAAQFEKAGLHILEQTQFKAYQHYGHSVNYGLIAAFKPA